MKKILIVGGGFTGIMVMEKLARHLGECDVTLIDKKKTFDFLPSLPDIIGERIHASYLDYDLKTTAGKHGCSFLHDEVTSVNLNKKMIKTLSRALDYDYLVIASGAENDFHGNEQGRKHSYPLYSVEDGKKILRQLQTHPRQTYVIIGGGYTGIEIATNIWRYFRKRAQRKRIVLVEIAPVLLGFLPNKLRVFVRKNLERMGIELRLGVTLDHLGPETLRLKNGEEFNDAMILWSTGVKTGDFVQALDVSKNRQGRVNVGPDLRLNESCFVLGDAANVKFKDGYLRMAVQFTLSEGICAAGNIIRSIRGQPLKTYDPIGDLGYVIPMANNRSAGSLLGHNVTGRIPSSLHYFMCVFRSYGLHNRLGMIRNILTRSPLR